MDEVDTQREWSPVLIKHKGIEGQEMTGRDEDGVGFRLSMGIPSGQYIKSISDLDGWSKTQITSPQGRLF